MDTNLVHIEQASTLEDAKDIHKLVIELAEFEKMPSGPEISADQLHSDLSAGHCFAFIARDSSSKAIAYVLCFYAYSTWQGRFIFMEDLYVTPSCRRSGIGTALWKRVAQVTVSKNLTRIQWNVLDWNSNAIKFYKKMGAIDLCEKEGWLTYRLCSDAIQKLANFNRN